MAELLASGTRVTAVICHNDVTAIGALLDDPERRTTMGAAGRARVEELFSWRAVAEATAAAYEETIADFRRERDEESRRADR